MSVPLSEDCKGLTVVTIEGDDIAVVDGLVRDGDDVRALQLIKTGLFGGSMDEVLPVTAIRGIGPDAVVVETAEPFVLPEDLDLDDWGFPIVAGRVPQRRVHLAERASAACPVMALRLRPA